MVGDSAGSDRGDIGGGATGSMSGEDGFERDVMAARSVHDWDRFLYVDDARPIVIDFGEPSRDFCFSDDSRLSGSSGVIRPVGGDGRGGGSWGVDLLEERSRDRKPGFEGTLPGDDGISCSCEPWEAVRSTLGL